MVVLVNDLLSTERFKNKNHKILPWMNINFKGKGGNCEKYNINN